MEWVETTGKTVEDAVEAALDQLGVDKSEVEYELLDEPKAGLFGRVRGEARIRARVRPATPLTKDDRRRKPAKTASATLSTSATSVAIAPSSAPARPAPRRAAKAAVGPAVSDVSGSDRSTTQASRPPRASLPRTPGEPVALDAVGAAATSFLQGFFSAADLEVDISTRRIDDETLEVRVDGQGLGVLVGPKGATLLALQELVRTHVHHATEGRSGRLMLDVAGYREKRRVALTSFTHQVAEAVLSSGERRAMEPMTAVDRKVVHDAVHDIDGISSVSEGEDPDRRVVLLPS